MPDVVLVPAMVALAGPLVALGLIVMARLTAPALRPVSRPEVTATPVTTNPDPTWADPTRPHGSTPRWRRGDDIRLRLTLTETTHG